MVDLIVYIDGEKFTQEMAYWFLLMSRDFEADTGCSLHASSALRFSWEQEAIFRDRYVPANQVNGRSVYDYRWWNGVQWARISSAGTVAVPRTSNHEFEVTGTGAVDVFDSGSDAGVSRRGSARDVWMANNAWKYNYENEGYNFDEAWHKKFLGNLYNPRPDWDIRISTPAGEEPAPEEEKEEDDDMNCLAFWFSADKKSLNVITFNTDSGWYLVHVTPVENEGYNEKWKNSVRAQDSAMGEITESHATALQKSLDKLAGSPGK